MRAACPRRASNRIDIAIASIITLLDSVHGRLEAAGVDHALIGAFALAAWGVQRATNDVDFLIDGAKAAVARQALESDGFTVFHASDDVLQMAGPGPVDFVLARRPLSLAMLTRASARTLRGIKCVEPEDLIGLKIQAYKNDPRRELQDPRRYTAADRGVPVARLGENQAVRRTFFGMAGCRGPSAPRGAHRTMTDDEYLEFVEQFLELFRDLEPRRPLEMNLALL